MGWVLVWWRYMTQELLSLQKHLSFTLQWPCLLQVHVYTWWTITPIFSVNAFTFTITTITLRIHVYNNDVYDIWNNPVSFQIFFLDIINMFPVSLLVVLCYKTHNSFVTCSYFWKCIPAVMYSCASLFNLGSCEPYRFRSHVRRQSNCMTMISQYVINFVDIIWASVEELTGKSFLLKVSSDTIPFLLSHIMPVFTMQVESGLSNWRQWQGKLSRTISSSDGKLESISWLPTSQNFLHSFVRGSLPLCFQLCKRDVHGGRNPPIPPYMQHYKPVSQV